jgi:hypothetical protein
MLYNELQFSLDMESLKLVYSLVNADNDAFTPQPSPISVMNFICNNIPMPGCDQMLSINLKVQRMVKTPKTRI